MLSRTWHSQVVTSQTFPNLPVFKYSMPLRKWSALLFCVPIWTTRLYLRAASQISWPFVDGLRKRLFDVNVFPRLAGQEGDVGVPMIGGGDNDALDIVVVQQVPELPACACHL